MGKIAIVGTLDTKESEAFFLKEQLESLGHEVIVMDVSCKESHPSIANPDLKQEYFLKKGNITADELSNLDRNSAVQLLSKVLENELISLQKSGDIDGVIGYGGSVGSELICKAFNGLPITFPKLIGSTVVNIVLKNCKNNITLFPSPVDFINGKRLNLLEKKFLKSVASAAASMVEKSPEVTSQIFITQMGTTTKCVSFCRDILQSKGYETVAFHAAGPGGDAFEEFIDAGFAEGVLDITTAEISNNFLGGIARTRNKRLVASIKRRLPTIICPGSLGNIVFEGPGTKNIPSKFKSRKFYYHNPGVTLMRIDKSESVQIGKIIADRINEAEAPTKVIIPMKGWGEYDKKGGVKTVDYYGRPTDMEWYAQEADSSFVETLEKYLNKRNPNIELIKVERHINDQKFATTICSLFIEMMERRIKYED